MNAPLGTTTTTAEGEITERVRERYAQAALRVTAGGGCCGGSCDDVSKDLYASAETSDLPEEAVLASLGCGNPTALIDLRPGETVLDLGSGGGIDVLLSARRVGPTGFVFGVDMTDEMLALAQANKARARVTNVAFLKGRIEAIPLPSNSVDVIISNCVINLAADKGAVLREAFRVLRPGGRFAVSDVVADGELPPDLRRDMEAWVGCLAGALELDTYRALLAEAGFEAVGIEITRRYTAAGAGLDLTDRPEWAAADGRLASAFVRATKPATALAAGATPTSAATPTTVGALPTVGAPTTGATPTTAAACCSTAEQTTCCEPTAKASCCGETTGGCGCR